MGVSVSRRLQSAGETPSTSGPNARLQTSAWVSQFTRQPRSSDRRYCSAEKSVQFSSWSPTKTLCSVFDLASPLGIVFTGFASPAKPTLQVWPPLSMTTRVLSPPMWWDGARLSRCAALAAGAPR